MSPATRIRDSDVLAMRERPKVRRVDAELGFADVMQRYPRREGAIRPLIELAVSPASLVLAHADPAITIRMHRSVPDPAAILAHGVGVGVRLQPRMVVVNKAQRLALDVAVRAIRFGRWLCFLPTPTLA